LRPAAKPDACVVGQKRSQRGENHFWRAFLALPPWPRTFRSAS